MAAQNEYLASRGLIAFSPRWRAYRLGIISACLAGGYNSNR